jgi:hypothetical protein
MFTLDEIEWPQFRQLVSGMLMIKTLGPRHSGTYRLWPASRLLQSDDPFLRSAIMILDALAYITRDRGGAFHDAGIQIEPGKHKTGRYHVGIK